MNTLTQREVLAREDVHFHEYVLNLRLIRTLEFGTFFLFCIAVCVYPFTHFDPKAWMIAPIILTIIGMAMLSLAQYWRSFVNKSFIAYDREYFMVCNHAKKAVCVPWAKIDLKSSGFADPKAGANLNMDIDGEKIRVLLYSGFACIPNFDNVMHALLTHIKENEEASKKQKDKTKKPSENESAVESK